MLEERGKSPRRPELAKACSAADFACNSRRYQKAQSLWVLRQLFSFCIARRAVLFVILYAFTTTKGARFTKAQAIDTVNATKCMVQPRISSSHQTYRFPCSLPVQSSATAHMLFYRCLYSSVPLHTRNCSVSCAVFHHSTHAIASLHYLLPFRTAGLPRRPT